MKKIITLALAIIALTSCKTQATTNEYEMLGLNCSVKSMKITTYKAVVKFGDIEKGDIESDAPNMNGAITCLYEFTDSTIVRTGYRKSGKIDNKVIYNYDINDNITSKYDYTFVTNFYGIKYTYYNYILYEYDTNGNLISEKYYNDDNILMWTETYEYDDMNRCIRSYHDGEPNESYLSKKMEENDYEVIRSYDENGKCYAYFHNFKTISQEESFGEPWEFKEWNPKSFIMDKLNVPDNLVSKYDDKGNWIEVIVYNEYKNPEYIIERKIEY